MKGKRLCSLVLCFVFCLMLIVTNMNVYASGNCKYCGKELIGEPESSQRYHNECYKASQGTTGLTTFSDDTLKASIGISDDTLKVMKGWVVVLQADGYSNAAISGLLANSLQESGCNPSSYTLESSGNYSGGLFGFTPLSKFCESSYNKNCTHEKQTTPSNDSFCANGACQFAYALDCFETLLGDHADRVDKYNQFMIDNKLSSEFHYTKESLKGKGTNILESVKKVTSAEEYKKLESPLDACAVFTLVYETCAGIYIPCGIPNPNTKDDLTNKKNWHKSWGGSYPGYTNMDFFLHEFNQTDGRPAKANLVYSWITGQTFSLSDADYETATDTTTALVESGVWSEDTLASFTTLCEENIQASYLDGATRDSLKQDDLSNLSNWEQNINNNKMETGFIATLRKFVMLLGIVFIIWVVLVYLAYWFDRINNFFYIDLLSILTFGQLHMSDTEEECTFRLKDLGKDGRKTVNHRAIIFICVVGIAFGVLLISGTLYGLIAKLVTTITSFLGQ